MKTKILITEDDASLCEIMSDYFTANDFIVIAANDGTSALEEIEKQKFDLILLDINLPDISGFEICKKLRRSVYSETPVLFITARVSEADKLTGYASGGDDYITKPFSLPVLLAKIKTLLARLGYSEKIVTYGKLSMNTEAHTIEVDGEVKELAPKEYELLLFLAENKGRLFSREQLVMRLWGYDYEGTDRAVDDHIRKLRKKLGECRNYIQTVRQSGYRFIVK